MDLNFIDTHCHLYLKDFVHDVHEVIRTAKQAGIKKFYFPAIDSETYEAMLNLENAYPGVCISMTGLHPCSVKENWKSELEFVHSTLEKKAWCAIGEIGLDYYWDTSFAKEQQVVFTQQMEWALAFKRPIVIHTRNAMQDTIDMVKPFAQKGLSGIFHCFGDSYTMATQIVDMGFFLGIGGVITYKKAAMGEVLDKIDLQHIVLETDAPYLTPVPNRGKRNESCYIPLIAAKLAEIKQCSLEEVAMVTTANAEKIFG
mgnify:FL=1